MCLCVLQPNACNLMRASLSPLGEVAGSRRRLGRRECSLGYGRVACCSFGPLALNHCPAHSAYISSTQSTKRGCAVNQYYNTASCLVYVCEWCDYIMPPMPGAPMGISGLSSFLSQMTHSVVRNMPATEAAFSRATRVTLAGSSTPASRRSPKVSVLAL